MIFLTMARPSPVPFGLCVTYGSVRRARSKPEAIKYEPSSLGDDPDGAALSKQTDLPWVIIPLIVQGTPEVDVGRDGPGVDADGLLEVADGLLPPALGQQGEAEAGVGRADVGADRQRRTVVADGLVPPARHVQRCAELEVEPEVLRVPCLHRGQERHRVHR